MTILVVVVSVIGGLIIGAWWQKGRDAAGVATVETPTELVETLKLLDHGGTLSGYRMASLSCSGGEASLVADLSETTSLTFSPFPDEQRSRIEATAGLSGRAEVHTSARACTGRGAVAIICRAT